MFVCIYTHIYTSMYVCVCVCVCMCVCVYRWRAERQRRCQTISNRCGVQMPVRQPCAGAVT